MATHHTNALGDRSSRARTKKRQGAQHHEEAVGARLLRIPHKQRAYSRDSGNPPSGALGHETSRDRKRDRDSQRSEDR